MDKIYLKHIPLKSKKEIETLFSEGKSVSKYPLRLVYIPLENTNLTNPVGITIGVSVSKKHFKKAVDRNYFKRVLREVFRKNKPLLYDAITKPYAMMFLYQSKDRLSFEEIEEKTKQLFEKFVERLND